MTSLTIHQLVKNEGKEIFSPKPYKPLLCLYSNGNRYKLQCDICSKFKHRTGGRVKYIEGDILSEHQIHT